MDDNAGDGGYYHDLEMEDSKGDGKSFNQQEKDKQSENGQNNNNSMSMDYADMMQMILKQSQKLEHVKNNVSESQDREQYMELIKQSSKEKANKFLTIDIGNESGQNIVNAP